MCEWGMWNRMVNLMGWFATNYQDNGQYPTKNNIISKYLEYIIYL